MVSQSVNEQGIVIKFYTLLGKSFSEIRDDLHSIYGDSYLLNGAILMRVVKQPKMTSIQATKSLDCQVW